MPVYALHCVLSLTLCSLCWFVTYLVDDHQSRAYYGGDLLDKVRSHAHERGFLSFIAPFYIPFVNVALLRRYPRARLAWIVVSALLVLLALDGWNVEAKETIVTLVMWAVNWMLLIPSVIVHAYLRAVR